MENKLKTIVSNTGKNAKNLLNNVVQVVDQNDDGKFDLSDVSVIAETVGKAMKKGSDAVKDTAEEKAKLLELKTLQPIFIDYLNDADFLMPKFIRVVDREKKYAESIVCQGAIGHFLNVKGSQVVNVFRDSIDVLGLNFYPDCDGEFYYVDPSDRDKYIFLDDYFNFLKIARVNELQKIAQDLGATYFKVTYKEEQTSFEEKKKKVHGKAVTKIDIEHNSAEKKYSTVEVAAEMVFPGHKPVKPQLKYMQRDTSIQNLIAMRMDESSPLLHQKFMLKMSNSSGMKEKDAISIDAILKGLKCTGNTTVESEARNESRRYLEYEIEF